MAKIAVTSLNTVRETPPVLTFAKTWHTEMEGRHLQPELALLRREIFFYLSAEIVRDKPG